MRPLLFLLVALFVVSSGCNSASNKEDMQADDRETSTTGNRIDDRLLFVGTAEETNSHAQTLLNSLRQQLETDLAELKQTVAAADSDQERIKQYVTGNPVPQFVEQSLQLALSFPDTPAAFEAALAAFGYAEGEQRDVAMNFMLDQCSGQLNHSRVVESLLGEIPGPLIESWLRKIVATAPDGMQQASAMLGFKTYFDQLPDFRLALKHNPQIADRLPANQMTYINTDPSPEQIAEQERYLQTVIDRYSELKYDGQQLDNGATFGEVAEHELYELKNLVVGKMAPDIEGQDLDGASFKLSDYRGKVIMLDFWGHWCPPCRRMYPHEQYLVRKMTGMPFVLVGVNSDRSLETAKKSVRDDKLPWRNFWNGPAGTAGPISQKWNVSEWPTVYLIDADGVIRFRGIQGDDLNRGIEQLMSELGHPVELTESVAQTN